MRFSKFVITGFWALSAALILNSCGSGDSKEIGPKETTSKGNINISVDETFMPVMTQQLAVFDSSYPDAHIKAVYTNEKQCFEDLFKNNARLIIVSRDVTANEKAAFDQNNVKLRTLGVAKDAVAVIVHPGATDTIMTMGQLKQILIGKFARKYTVVFDNTQSSTVRYIVDSLIPGQQLSSNTFAVKNNDSLIAYVSKNENAIGFVGVTHVYDPESAKPEGEFLKQVKVVALKDENDTTVNDFYQPYQAYIALKKYPLTRTIYFITRDNWSGLGVGFANFLSGDVGQLIFNKARLMPLRVPLNIREAEIKQ